MANEVTKIIDTILPEQYTAYTNYQSEKHSAFIQSGIMVPTPALDATILSGGKLLTMPEWGKTQLKDQVLNEERGLETGKVTAKKQVAHVIHRGTGASYSDLAAIISGSNPRTQLLNDFADYTLESDQAIIQSIIKALFAKGSGDNKGALVDSHVSDQSEAQNPIICPEMVIDARSILGTSRSKLTVIAMHSKVKTELEKQNVQTKHFIPASESKSGFDTYLGMRVIEDDTLIPVDGVYETYLYATGSFGRNTTTPKNLITYEPDRDRAKGINMLYVRRSRVIHPFGLSFTNKQVSDETPTNADLALAQNWEKVRENKKIGLICIRHRISADIPPVAESSVAFDVNGDVKPTEAQKIEEIKAWLTAHEIDFTGKTVKADLLALVPKD